MIRPAQPKDAARIADLLGQLGHPATISEARTRIDSWTKDPHSVLIVAEVDGTVAGVAALHAMPYLEYDARRGRLVAIVVDDDHRRRGVARALLKHMEEEARRLGCRDLEVTSARYRTAAQRFYNDLGYVDKCERSARFVKELGGGGL